MLEEKTVTLGESQPRITITDFCLYVFSLTIPAMISLLVLAFHRGYMRDCYHSACDVNSEKVSKINYEFLKKTTQVT